jgi:hypothetical protein
MWSIGWAPNNASKWQVGFNWAFKELMFGDLIETQFIYSEMWSKFYVTLKNFQTSKYVSWFQTFAVFWMSYAFFWVILRRL